MIAKLKGILDEIGEDRVVVDVGGIGYEVFCPSSTLAGLPRPGEAVSMVIITHVREDRIQLFGFANEYEKEWFSRLQGVQGVGTRLAMAILSALSPEELAGAIAAQDAQALARAPGVGNKLAVRIANELKDKVPAFIAIPSGALGGALGGGQPNQVGDAVSALVNLGYRQSDALGTVARISQEQAGDVSLEELIRTSLRELSA